jgi:sulfoacetaldehyde dehydrogenase
MVSVLSMPEMKEKLLAQGGEAASSSPAELEAIVRDELKKWEFVIREAKITPEDDARMSERDDVAALIARARAAQRIVDGWDQAGSTSSPSRPPGRSSSPARNRALAECAVRDTGLGNVEDKIAKNRRKTMGLVRDLAGAKTVGVIAEDRARGLIEIARPAGVVAAITPSTNPGATPANNIVNALKCRNAIVLAPSPKGASTLALLLTFVYAELDRIGAPRDLVLSLPSP